MLRIRNFLPLAAAALVGAAVLGAPTRADAAFSIRYAVDGGGFTTVADGGVGDTDGLVNGSITTTVPGVGGIPTAVVTASGSTFLSPLLTLMDVQFNGVVGAHDIVVQGSLTDIATAPAPQTLTNLVTGNSLPAGATLRVETWIDDNNGLFATSGAGIVVDTGSLTPPAAFTQVFTATPPYSITSELHIVTTLPATSVLVDSNNSITAAPAPGGLALVLAAAPTLGLGAWFRRRRAPAVA